MPENSEHTHISPLQAGLTLSYPRCGKGKLYGRFLELDKECSACGLDYGFADAGDGPAVFVIMITGFIIVGLALFVEISYQPPYWIDAVLWLPLALILTIIFLRPLKALLVALQYKHKAKEGRRV